ncbi:MAG TPA: hypothetical protein VIG97_08840, partial [Luteimonas sp.]
MPALAVAMALAVASCSTPGEAPRSTPTDDTAIEGTVASIDTQPWTYDGHALVQVDVPGRGRVSVQLPARWNLCQAAPVDVEALRVGLRVQAVGTPEGADVLTVCSGAAHRLVPLDADGADTRGGDGSAIELAPLSAAEVEAAALEGELGCSFSSGEAGQAPLLIAMGDVASSGPARGVVKVGDEVERVAAPGGFDAMLRGTRFAGAGKTLDITLTGAASGGGESPARPASLAYLRADGAERTWTGWWQCGP